MVYILTAFVLLAFLVFALRALRRESRYINRLTAEHEAQQRADEEWARGQLYGRGE